MFLWVSKVHVSVGEDVAIQLQYISERCITMGNILCLLN